MSPIRVLIVDDFPLVRESLAIVLRRAGIEVVGLAGDGFEAIGLVDQLKPDVVLMDLRMPLMDGLEAAGYLKMSGAKVIGFTSDANPDARRPFEDCVEALIDKGANLDEIVNTVRRVALC